MEKIAKAKWGYITYKIGEKMNNNKQDVSSFIKKSLRMESGVNHLFFITIRFRDVKTDLDKAKESTRLIMSRVLFKLQGRYWYKKPCKGVYVIENGKYKRFHTHIILNIGNRTVEQLDLALNNVKENCPRTNICYDLIEEVSGITNFNLNKNHLCVMPVYDLNKLIEYVLKEFHWNSNHINFENFYTEQQMFNY